MIDVETEEQVLSHAFDAWLSNHAYIDGNGNYHCKDMYKSSGPIAPWNKTIKRLYPSYRAFHDAAIAWHRAITQYERDCQDVACQ